MGLTYDELKRIQTWEKTMSGKSAISSLFPTINPNGASIIFEEAALWLLARSNTDKGKEFAKKLVETFVAVRNGYYIPIEDLKRLEARKRLTETEKKFAEIIYSRVVDEKGIAEIRAIGDRHLFGGNTTGDMKKKYGIEKTNKPLADLLPTVSIKAKDLALEMTSVNTQQKNLLGKEPIKQEHVDNSRAVRSTLEIRGIRPEELPPEEDTKKLEKKYKKPLKIQGGLDNAITGISQIQ